MDIETARRQLRETGCCVFPNALSKDELARAREALDRGAELARQAGVAHDARLDPNASNIRVYNLPALDPVFIELVMRPDALAAAAEVLGPHFLLSNFTANIALPGSLSMRIHSDQALVVPPPWLQPWAMNIIWCLDDVYERNGATRYVPGSHRFQTFEDVPTDVEARTVAFEAPAGSFVAMEGRMWHTSGANVMADGQRRMMFAYYSSDFVRPQVNWEVLLSGEVKAGMNPEARRMFGLGAAANTRIGGSLTRLQQAAAGL